MLANFLASEKSISPSGRALQMFSLVVLLMLSALSAMAYDHWCSHHSPLLCSALVSGGHVCCIVLVYFSGGVTSMVHVDLTVRLPFCGSNNINHFFLWYLAFPGFILHKHLHQTSALFLVFSFIKTSAFVVIFILYFCVLLTVLSIKSSGGRSKTFSTCASHLLANQPFYGTLLFMYLHPTISYSPDTDKVVAAFYTIVFPMFDPIIYSLPETKRCKRD